MTLSSSPGIQVEGFRTVPVSDFLSVGFVVLFPHLMINLYVQSVNPLKSFIAADVKVRLILSFMKISLPITPYR